MTDITKMLARRLRPYGLTVEDYEQLLEAQDHRCAICEKKLTVASRPANVDHDHRSGRARGLLCQNCNTTIGYLHEDAEWLRRAQNHLLSPIADRVFDKPRVHIDAPPQGES